VKNIYCYVELSCEEFEDIHGQEEWISNSKSVNKVKRKLKRLSCSINYNSMGGSSSRSKVKGRGIPLFS
jgi:hypothetical protein